MCHTYVFFILKWAAKVIACYFSLKCVCFFFSPLVYFIATACWCEYISFSRFVTIILYAHFYIYFYVYFMMLNNVFIPWIRVSFFLCAGQRHSFNCFCHVFELNEIHFRFKFILVCRIEVLYFVILLSRSFF